MKSSTIFQLFIGIHVVLIVGHIYRHTRFVRGSFARQRAEYTHLALKHRLEELNSQLYALQDRESIQQYAKDSLGMKPVSLSQVKKLAS